MVTPLLATKLHPPTLHPRRVARARLVERLEQGLALGRPLALVSAPAGFGKTTCVCEWLHSQNRPAAWLTLESSDDNPLPFFRYFLAALQRLSPGVGRAVEGALRNGELPPPEALTAALVDDLLDLDQPLILVCDDFHTIQDADILAILARLIHQRLPGLHLVLVTREDPLLPLARLRANDLLTEIRAADLRFLPAEAAGLLRDTLGLALSAADVAALEERTEGWAAGLQLAGLSLRGRGDAGLLISGLGGGQRHILNYLVEEVLERQTAATQAFLLQTAILDRLSGDLCDTVTGVSGSGDLLARLFQANLFLVALEDEGASGAPGWYRYHGLFRDLLRSLQNRLPPGLPAELHRRAADWFARAGLVDEAIRHALESGDVALALTQVEQHALTRLATGDVQAAESWLGAIPPELCAASAPVSLAAGWLYLLRGAYARAGESAARARAVFADAPGGVTEAGLLALEANLANVQARPEQGAALARRALDLAAPEDHFVRGQAALALGGTCRLLGDYAGLVQSYQLAIQHAQAAGNILGESIAVAGLALAAYQRGELNFVLAVILPLIERVERHSAAPPPITGTVYGALSMVYYQRNHLDEARAALERSLQLSELGRHNAGLVYSKALLARVRMASGDLEQAARLVAESRAALQQGAPAWLRPDVIDQHVRLHLAQHRPDLAEALLAEENVSFPAGAPQLALSALRVAVQRAEALPLAAARTAAGAALADADRLVRAAEEGQRMEQALQGHLLRARLLLKLGEAAQAQAALERAVALGQPEGFVWIFVEQGPALAAPLRALQSAGDPRYSAYLAQLLAAFPPAGTVREAAGNTAGVTAGVTAGSSPPAPALVEPLSEREIEVLRLIAEGLKYEEIAAQLVVSLNTVRFHVKMIYGKLGVNNRTRAVETARAQGILPSSGF